MQKYKGYQVVNRSCNYVEIAFYMEGQIRY